MRYFINAFIFLTLTVLAWLLRDQYAYPYSTPIFQTFLSLTIIYLLFKVGLENLLVSGIKERKTRYYARKTVSMLYMTVFIGAILAIWIQRVEALLVAYGIIGAGVAVALQDVLKSLAGGIWLLINRPYSVGDRIELGGVTGDVIDIGVMSTQLLEIKGWIKGDQATGRILTIPNSLLLSSVVMNYSKNTSFIWDEIEVPVTYRSDWKKAVEIIMTILQEETESNEETARKELGKLTEEYYFSKREVTPTVYVTFTDNWILLTARYVTQIRKRRAVTAEISRRILERFEKNKRITVASQTFEITGVPDLKVKK